MAAAGCLALDGTAALRLSTPLAGTAAAALDAAAA
eukprot:CAMPEP_0174721938 /NCGR_PEP_ID=MMETSP1094-20130205/37532_1 /TAXON_ID=156173 /ORGANISM="Chrysochromulina brevifilum, Strain UTEX LB 985" /LENGTH=34 /DNA_ID= /DNA_START= /DNA_END= /DNA_ORIENTATION=